MILKHIVRGESFNTHHRSTGGEQHIETRQIKVEAPQTLFRNRAFADIASGKQIGLTVATNRARVILLHSQCLCAILADTHMP